MVGEIYYSRKFLLHKLDNYHPENPGRLWLVLTAIRELNLEDHIEEPSPIEETLIYKIHEREYVETIRKLSLSGGGYLDADTYVGPRTWEAAILALGASRQAALSALEYGELNMALVRPPGHHAGRRGRAMGAPTLGFCIFNNVAMAALTLKMEVGKALIIDFDAHHGNGTQEIFWDDADVVHIDLHEREIYPGTGDVGEIGGIRAKGTKVNLPMPHYSTDGDYIYAWNEVVMPIVDEFKPKIVLVSAGFDGFKGDGLTTLKLTEMFYSYAGSSLRKYPVALILEGGYSTGLKKGFPAFILGYEEERSKDHGQPSYETLKLVEEVKDILSPWWSL
ncbi:histone deacetylase related protein [Pyrococcus sp. NA2]|uniref:histone deacetylase family protein n=1 Tax=Pyrococcus sp. (strain NA2) TaxID=342949 RepID=UPI000209AC78|nr:histone deacetylase family protein [Pyrococcus sp. NA2]AEC52760.1 histone deacetylase related protein [Pyrococcus sp. NA2]